MKKIFFFFALGMLLNSSFFTFGMETEVKQEGPNVELRLGSITYGPSFFCGTSQEFKVVFDEEKKRYIAIALPHFFENVLHVISLTPSLSHLQVKSDKSHKKHIASPSDTNFVRTVHDDIKRKESYFQRNPMNVMLGVCGLSVAVGGAVGYWWGSKK